MGGSLSQEEIDALLNGSAGGGDSEEANNGIGTDVSADTANANLPPNGGKSSANTPSEMELGILGEIYNISMGAAAKAVATLVKMKVDITTPNVKVMKRDELVFKTLEPAVGVRINYIEGIQGENIFILSQVDIMKLVDIVLGGTGSIDENSEFTDMHMSAIGEVMNQMMGASSMNVAEFLNLKIDISVPETFKIDGDYTLTVNPDDEMIVATEFKFIVGDIINSEMITTCSLSFARDLIQKAMKTFGMSFDESPPEVVETTVAETVSPPQIPEPEPEPQQQPEPTKKEEAAPVVQQPAAELPAVKPEVQPQTQQYPPAQEIPPAYQIQQPLPQYQPQQYQQYPQMAPVPSFDTQQIYSMFAKQNELLLQLTEKLASNQAQTQPQSQQPTVPVQQQQYQPPQSRQSNVSAQTASFVSFDNPSEPNEPFENNMDLVLDLSLEVSVEIGKARKSVNEVLELGEGVIIELDKQAGDPLDIYVNGNLIAKGSVVVIEENFAVRITEIVSPQDKLKAARNKK